MTQSRNIVAGVPSPYGVAFCTTPILQPLRLLASSPAANSVSILDALEGTVLATIPLGPQPYSAACLGSGVAVVSSFGNSTLSVIDVNTLAVTATIPDIPGSRGWRGVALTRTQAGPVLAWIAGTGVDQLTVVNLSTRAIAARIPVRRPAAVRSFDDTQVCVSHELEQLTCYDNSLQVISRRENIPAAQDFVSYLFDGARGGVAAVTADSKLVLESESNFVIAGISGAAAVGYADYSNTLRSAPQAVLLTQPEGNRLLLVQRAIEPSEFALVNGASFDSVGARRGLAPGSLGTTFVTTGVSQHFSASSAPLPLNLGGVRLRIGGSAQYDLANSRWVYSPLGSVEAPLLFVSPGQINFQIPPGIAPAISIAAQIQRPDGSMLLTTLNVVASAPGIFTASGSGQGQAAVLNQDGSLNGNPATNIGARPARRGSVVQIFATGAGETTPTLLAGEPAPVSGSPLILTNIQPTVTIGGVSARVQFSGMAPGYVGLWQINAEIPAGVTPGTAVPLVVTVPGSGGGVSSNTVTIAVE